MFDLWGKELKYQACPWECHSYGNPMGNVPWDGTGINCYVMGMGQINMSHGQSCEIRESIASESLQKTRTKFYEVAGYVWVDLKV